MAPILLVFTSLLACRSPVLEESYQGLVDGSDAECFADFFELEGEDPAVDDSVRFFGGTPGYPWNHQRVGELEGEPGDDGVLFVSQTLEGPMQFGGEGEFAEMNLTSISESGWFEFNEGYYWCSDGTVVGVANGHVPLYRKDEVLFIGQLREAEEDEIWAYTGGRDNAPPWQVIEGTFLRGRYDAEATLQEMLDTLPVLVEGTFNRGW